MRTTVHLTESLHRRAKAYAAQHGRTLTSMVEEGLLRVIGPDARARSKYQLAPASHAKLNPELAGKTASEILALLDEEEWALKHARSTRARRGRS